MNFLAYPVLLSENVRLSWALKSTGNSFGAQLRHSKQNGRLVPRLQYRATISSFKL